MTRCGLRWYKNRIVVNYDTDSKNLLRARSRDGIRSLLTMAYVTTGRLLLANSFAQLSPEIIFDLTRIYPFHTTPLTARPVDAFMRKYPRIYDFQIDPQWHQLTFYNTSNEEGADISVKLSADAAEGGLGLDSAGQYHAYDFWNGAYIGKLAGSGSLTQNLRPDEARMMSIHEVVDHPQFISTNRHVMQGYVDLKDVSWDPRTRQIKGSAQVVGGETYKIVFATNGYQAKVCSVSCHGVEVEGRIESLSLEDNLIELIRKGDLAHSSRFETVAVLFTEAVPFMNCPMSLYGDSAFRRWSDLCLTSTHYLISDNLDAVQCILR